MGTPTGASTTPYEPLRAMCFTAMPFGRKAGRMTIDFNRTWEFIRRGIADAGLEAIRADFEPGGGFIHKVMLERLLVAEYVVADLTMANPNVMYEVGVRHGASGRATLLLCADALIDKIPFDFKPLRMVSYDLAGDGALADDAGTALARVVCERLRQARSGWRTSRPSAGWWRSTSTNTTTCCRIRRFEDGRPTRCTTAPGTPWRRT